MVSEQETLLSTVHPSVQPPSVFSIIKYLSNTMGTPSSADLLRELHSDLYRKYNLHATAIESIWRSLDAGKRTKCLKAGVVDGAVLKHSMDQSLGNVYKFVPEINLRDVTKPGSDFLLDVLRHRATTSLIDQYGTGVNGGPGDLEFIEEMMRTRGLKHVESFTNCFTTFLDEESYGCCYKALSHHTEMAAGLAPGIQARLIVPQATGELILIRQSTIIQSLNILIEDILDEGSKTRDQKKPSKKPDKAASKAVSKLTYQNTPAKLVLADLLAHVHDQKDDLKDYLALLSTEPVVLAYAVNTWFFSQPELVADEKGRILPVHTDKYISATLFEAIHSTIRGAATWDYISRLLELLGSPTLDKTYRAFILQELSNTCHLEYKRLQATFKRHIQTGINSKWFRRVSNSYDNFGNARVNLKRDLPVLTEDPQLYYALRLCHPDTNASKAVDWMKKLGDLHKSHPLDRENIGERVIDSTNDLAVIIGFIHDLSSVVSIPPLSNKNGQIFIRKSEGLQVELNTLKKQVDLRDFVVPIDNLLEPGKAKDVLNKLDKFIVEKTGTKMGFLYQDLVEDCLVDLQTQYEQAQVRLKEGAKIQVDSLPPPPVTSQPEQKRVEQRKQKEKTRPAHSSVYGFTQMDVGLHIEELTLSPPQTFKVSSSAAEVFTTLFTKSLSRGAINWTAFEAAMAELGFSIQPKLGSIYTFYPPDTMAVKRPFNAHRPHESKIEGRIILIFAQRLRRVYGWGQETFEVA